MADDAKFEENGVKLLASLGMMATGGGTVAGLATFVDSAITLMTSGDTTDAVDKTRQEVDQLRTRLAALTAQLNNLTGQVATAENRQDLARLNDHLDDFRIQALRLHDKPGDVDTAVGVANAVGIKIDAFLRNDFEMWRWTDVVEKNGIDELRTDRFKNAPTLPIYLSGITTWLAARETVVAAGQRSRLDDDAARVVRHRDAVSVRDVFDKYAGGVDGTPTTIPENIKSRIRAFVMASTAHPVNRTCSYHFEFRDWMSNRQASGDGFDEAVESDAVLCTIDPASLGAPATELQWETDAGVEVLRSLATALDRVVTTGTLRDHGRGDFLPMTVTYVPAVLYVVAQNGDLLWYSNEGSNRPGGSTVWTGPTRIGTGWHGFTHVFSGGGPAIYGIAPDGSVTWYGFDGFLSGTPNWRGPYVVDMGWLGYRSVFSGGEYVIYAIAADGRLWWHCHRGGQYGLSSKTDWAGRVEVGTGWDGFAKVFSGGRGVIYAIDKQGGLHRIEHRGYLKGTYDWGPWQHIGNGWDAFADVTASTDGVIYGVKRNGDVYWARYGKPRPKPDANVNGNGDGNGMRFIFPVGLGSPPTPAPAPAPTGRMEGTSSTTEVVDRPILRITDKHSSLVSDTAHEVGRAAQRLALLNDGPVWEGPVVVKHGVPGFRSVFAGLNAPPPADVR